MSHRLNSHEARAQQLRAQLQTMLIREGTEFARLGQSSDVFQRSRFNCLENVYELCHMHHLSPNCMFLAARLLDLYCTSVAILRVRDLVIAAIATVRLACTLFEKFC